MSSNIASDRSSELDLDNNPNYSYNDITLNMGLYDRKKQILNAFFASAIIGLTYPLEAITVALQQSVGAHVNLYGQEAAAKKRESLVKELVTTQRQITPHERRMAEIQIKFSATEVNQPFMAPVYRNYREAFRGFWRLGAQAFFRGMGPGAFVTFCHSLLKTKLDSSKIVLSGEETFLSNRYNAFLVITALEFFLQPFRMCQSRKIMMSTHRDQRVYHGIIHMIYSMTLPFSEGWKGFIKGSTARIPYIFGMGFMLNKREDQYFLPLCGLTLLICYPFEVIGRRLECQHAKPGFIPTRYKNAFHGVRLIFAEEGVRGAYRGFSLFIFFQAVRFLAFYPMINAEDVVHH